MNKQASLRIFNRGWLLAKVGIDDGWGSYLLRFTVRKDGTFLKLIAKKTHIVLLPPLSPKSVCWVAYQGSRLLIWQRRLSFHSGHSEWTVLKTSWAKTKHLGCKKMSGWITKSRKSPRLWRGYSDQWTWIFSACFALEQRDFQKPNLIFAFERVKPEQ